MIFSGRKTKQSPHVARRQINAQRRALVEERQRGNKLWLQLHMAREALQRTKALDVSKDVKAALVDRIAHTALMQAERWFLANMDEARLMNIHTPEQAALFLAREPRGAAISEGRAPDLERKVRFLRIRLDSISCEMAVLT